MLDLYLILIPAFFITLVTGLWIIRGMSPKARVFGKALSFLVAFCVTGIVAIAFVSSIVGLVILVASIGYYLYKYRNSGGI